MEFISPWIHTTNRCNLKCHYCYVTGNEDMSVEVYDQLYKFLMGVPTEFRHLRFAGGEPTLVFDKWKQFANKMLEHKGTTVEVLTNLINPPEDFWEFAIQKDVNISVSIDNGKQVKVLNKAIIQSLERLNNPWILTTLTEENIDAIEGLAIFIGMNNYGWAITTDYFLGDLDHWQKLASVVLGITSILKQFKYDFSKISFNNFSIKSRFSGCRAGNEMITIAPNGDIYRCQTEINQGHKIGDVINGYIPQSIAADREACKECNIVDFCYGWCPIYFKVPNNMCNVIKIFANQIIPEVNLNAI